jgi:hypothetical protein
MPLWVLVDTGSPWIAITPHDAMMLNIPFPALKKATEFPTIVFAGHKFQRLLLTDVALRARNETGEIVTFDLPSISILSPTKETPLEEFKGIPSVLGADFLNTKGLCLHFNPSKTEAFLSTS